MIDGIVLSSYNDCLRQRIEASPLLSDTMSNHVSVKTGEVYSTAAYNDLQFKICASGRIEIKGSLHKYCNSVNNCFIDQQKHNANDFNMADIKKVLHHLSNCFGPDILSSKVDSIEFGLNIQTEYTARHFIEQNITMLKGKRPKHPIIANSVHGFTCGIKYVFGDYWLKLYDKGNMYGIGDNLLRCEYKALKMRAIKHSGISILSDIVDYTALEVLFTKLIEAYSFLLIREEFNENDFSVNDLRMYDNGFNPDYWTSLNRQLRTRKKAQFERLYADHARTDLKGEILKLLKDKFNELT